MLALEDGSMDAAAKPRRRSSGRSHKRGQGVASQQAVQGLTGIIALGLQGASEVAATATETPEVALLPGETERDPGEAEILALLPAQWMAKTTFGREVGKYLISDEHKAVALTLLAYLMRVGPPLYAKVKAADVARRANATPTRRTPVQEPPQERRRRPWLGRDGQPSGDQPSGVVIPIVPGIIGAGPVLPSRPSANGAHPGGESSVIPVPRL